MCHSTSCAFKLLNTYTHLTQHFSLCRARRWAQRHTGTSSRIHPLLSAVHQHTYTHMAHSHGHGVRASPSPPARLGFCCKKQARGGRTGGYYTSGTWVGWTDWIEIDSTSRYDDILQRSSTGRHDKLTHRHYSNFWTVGKTDPIPQESLDVLLFCPVHDIFMIQLFF